MANDSITLPVPLPAVLDALIHSDKETAGQPTLAPGSSPPLLEWLRRILVDRDALRVHIQFLTERLDSRFRHDQPLGDEEIEIAVHGGLFLLPEGVVARLALNPVALRDLADEMRAQYPSPEPADTDKIGRRLMDELGLTIGMLSGAEPLPPGLREAEERFVRSAVETWQPPPSPGLPPASPSSDAPAS